MKEDSKMARDTTTQEALESVLYSAGTDHSGQIAEHIYNEFVKPLESKIRILELEKQMYHTTIHQNQYSMKEKSS